MMRICSGIRKTLAAITFSKKTVIYCLAIDTILLMCPLYQYYTCGIEPPMGLIHAGLAVFGGELILLLFKSQSDNKVKIAENTVTKTQSVDVSGGGNG